MTRLVFVDVTGVRILDGKLELQLRSEATSKDENWLDISAVETNIFGADMLAKVKNFSDFLKDKRPVYVVLKFNDEGGFIDYSIGVKYT